ncbi:MAG: translation initiation factor 2 [Desulfovibrio sp.]|nr:translation initiation factor 2 [Desulfovibrio sp.]
MRFLLTFVLIMGVATSGCAMFGGSSETSSSPQPVEPASSVEPASEVEPAPVVKAEAKKGKKEKKSKKTEKSSQKSKKTEAEIAAELDKVGHKLAAQASRTVMPSKASKEVRKVGQEYVATYVDVDANNVRTELRPSSKAGQYVGSVRYQEKVMECRGASKQAALGSTNCRQVKTRNLNELIHYDGSSWQY